MPDHLPNRMRSPRLNLQGDDVTLFVTGAWTDSDNFALHRFFPGGVGYDDAACGLFLGVEAANHHAIVQRSEFHWIMSNLVPADEGWSACRLLRRYTSGALF